MTQSDKQLQSSSLFLVRIWDDGPDGAPPDTRRGKILQVLTGEARYFQGWADLISVIQRLSEDKAHMGPVASPESGSGESGESGGLPEER